ncbi:unnamed protein product [Trichogramma brassicae]|uniref:Uncharacterized protein n=1 Tax=Trichogramma brassicae TaxID=86971 RepID=A0A6H5IGN4_9HYME|nr:unnamed protein product [Trichogramma brassicae]
MHRCGCDASLACLHYRGRASSLYPVPKSQTWVHLITPDCTTLVITLINFLHVKKSLGDPEVQHANLKIIDKSLRTTSYGSRARRSSIRNNSDTTIRPTNSRDIPLEQEVPSNLKRLKRAATLDQ